MSRLGSVTKLQEKEETEQMRKLILLIPLLMIGCTNMIVSETEACSAIVEKSDKVVLSRTDHPESRQSVGELLIMIESVCKGNV